MPRKFYQKWLSCCKILKRLLFPPKAATVKIECFNPYLKTSLIRLRMKRSLQSLISFFSGLGQIFVFCSRSQETYLLLRQKEQIGSSFENFFPYSCYYFLALGSCNISKINFLLSKLFIDILLFFDKWYLKLTFSRS